MVQRCSQLIDTCPATQRMRLLAVCVIREASGKTKENLGEEVLMSDLDIKQYSLLGVMVLFSVCVLIIWKRWFPCSSLALNWTQFTELSFSFGFLIFFFSFVFLFSYLGLNSLFLHRLPNNSRMWHLFVYFWPLYEMVVEGAKSNGTMRVTVTQSGIKEPSGSCRFIPKAHQDLACLIKCAALDPA